MAILNAVSGQKPRQIAVSILKQRLRGHDYTEDLFEQELAKHRLSAPDRGLCQELVYGIARWQKALDWLIARKTEGRTQKDELRILLQLGLYQMFWLDRIPGHAAVHETVEIAKHLGFGPQAGFVNAVLRGYDRERAETAKLLADLKLKQPAVGFSHPDWLVERWIARYGADKAAQLMQWNNTPPPTYARVNLLKTTTAKLTALLEAEKVQFVAPTHNALNEPVAVPQPETLNFKLETLHLTSHPPLATLRTFKDGLFYIQDPSTLFAVQMLDPQPGESILDLCAAPGGKTTYIAQRMQNRGRIIAQDIHEDRLALIRENCVRLGVTNVEASLAPTGIIENPSKKFDRILVDAPCSNTGVMRRRVDLRWRIRPEEIERLRAAQLDLLRQAAPRLKPGGVLVYSTCSLEPEENSEVVKQFLAEQPKFSLEKEHELLPFADTVDGAYVVRLKN